MHNKSFTADNQASILGGRNIGDEYFEANPELAFGDLDVLVIGPAVKQVSASFDSYWNSELAYPASVLKGEPPTAEQIRDKHRQLDELVARQVDSPYLQALRNSNLANRLRNGEVRYRWGEARIVADQPEKILNPNTERGYHLAPMLRPYFSSVQDELIIFSPYFVPGKVGTALLKQLRERGVRVRILTNSLASTDVAVVHAGYARYRRELLQAGIELYEVDKKIGQRQRRLSGSSKASLHAKSFVFDRKHVFIGSLNLDPRSVLENTEIGVVLESPEIGREMGDGFDRRIDDVAFRLELAPDQNGRERIVWNRIENGERSVYTVEPHTGFWQRFSVGLLGLLPIESQL
jgi:putative cardiolipin synthase